MTGKVTINGVEYPIQDFTISWDNDLQPYRLSGSNEIQFYSPYFETDEQRDRRLNPRKYDYCKFCDHCRFRHESNYGKCTGINFEADCDDEVGCECKEFV